MNEEELTAFVKAKTENKELADTIARGDIYRALAHTDGFRLLMHRIEREAGEALRALRTPYLEPESLRETVIVWREWERMIDVIKNEVFSAIDAANELQGGIDA